MSPTAFGSLRGNMGTLTLIEVLYAAWMWRLHCRHEHKQHFHFMKKEKKKKKTLSRDKPRSQPCNPKLSSSYIIKWNAVWLYNLQMQIVSSDHRKQNPDTPVSVSAISLFTFSGSLAVASHLLLAGFVRGTHSPPWSKDTTDCTELSGT